MLSIAIIPVASLGFYLIGMILGLRGTALTVLLVGPPLMLLYLVPLQPAAQLTLYVVAAVWIGLALLLIYKLALRVRFLPELLRNVLGAVGFGMMALVGSLALTRLVADWLRMTSAA